MKKDHIYFMKKAFEEAKYAFYKNEVPVGCVIVNENEIISRSSNMVELLNDSTAHAELIAITSAQNYLNSKNLEGCTLYATLPCLVKLNLKNVTLFFVASKNSSWYSGSFLDISTSCFSNTKLTIVPVM